MALDQAKLGEFQNAVDTAINQNQTVIKLAPPQAIIQASLMQQQVVNQQQMFQ